MEQKELLYQLFSNKPFIELLENGEATIIPNKGVLVLEGWNNIQEYLENIKTEKYVEGYEKTGGTYDGIYFYIINKTNEN